MKDTGARRLSRVVAGVASLLVGFYVFMGWRAVIWTPFFCVQPTEKAFSAPAHRISLGNSNVDQGKRLFERMQCAVCHGPEGRGGVHNPNADPDDRVSRLIGLSQSVAPDFLANIIRNGRRPFRKDDGKAKPPLDMPAWKDALSDIQINDLVAYILSLKASQSVASDTVRAP